MKIFLGVAVLLMLPSAAFAQGNPGPFGGLFGRTPERVNDSRIFEIRTVASGQYDDPLLDETMPAESGAIGSFTVSGLFEEKSTKLNLQLRSAAAYQQYMEPPYVGGTAVASGVSANYKVATRLALDGGFNHLYTPHFQFYRLPDAALSPSGVIVPPSSPYVATLLESNSYEVTGGFTSFYSKRSTASVSFMRRDTRFQGRNDANAEVQGVRGMWTRQMSRDLRLRLGYGQERSRLANTPDAEYIHEFLDVGFDYDRALSLSRRTRVAFSTETSMVRKPGTGRHYRLNGRAMLTRAFQKTWQVSAIGTRLTEFLPGFTEPLFSDNLGINVSGMVSDRADLTFTTTAGKGVVGTDESAFVNPRFTMAHASARLSVALARHVGVFAQHSYDYYELPAGASLVAPLDRVARQIFVFGIQLWFPVMSQERTSDSR